MFHSKYKRKNPSYVLEVFVELCVESFMRSERCLPSYTHIDSHKELDGCFSCCIKKFQEDLKHLRGVSKSQVGELMTAAGPRKM